MISNRGLVFSHQIRPALPLTNSEKNKGDAARIASSFAQNIFCNQNLFVEK